MKIHCHCGDVTISLPNKPLKLNGCSCSICRQYGAIWAYFPPKQVQVSGTTDTYIWGDRMIAFHRCQTCGVLTHWSDLSENAEKMGVNYQNADVLAQADIPRYDGKAR